MKLKRYLVDDMKEAMEMIRLELGPEAILVSSRKVRRPGLKGLFSSPRWEVTAAVDEPIVTVRNTNGTDQRVVQQELMEIKEMLLRANMDKRLHCETEDLERWKKLLLELELNQETIASLFDSIREQVDIEEKGCVGRDLVKDSLAGLLPARSCYVNEGIYCFVGPTGVGKTTTLAKLAAEAVFRKKLDVALVTIDTYRIGAVEQLRIYADIMDVPLRVVMSAQELKLALAEFRQKNVIYIDTAGRPSSNALQISELKSFLQDIELTENYLVLSSNTKDNDLLRAARDFNSVNYTSLIFTKLDETSTLGSIVNIANSLDKPVAYVTNGQNVPDDIQPVDAGKLSELIIKAVG